MSTMEQTKRRAPAGAYVAMVATALVGAGVVGGIAALTRSENSGAAFLIFAACTLAPMAMLGWFVFVSRYTVTVDAHANESVEHRWYAAASYGAFHDLITMGGIALLVLSISRLDVDGTDVLLWFLILAALDVAVRYQVLKRRES